MRFQTLHVPAFGPFTNVELTFPDNPIDLHIVYGANEAGKSSLLRAFRDLLFGIHGQSSDNFLHDYKALRIKGTISNQAGTELIFQRRKGNKNTLLDVNGEPLPDSALAAFLGSVDQAYFSTMFGLGFQELHAGAAQLLRGEGDMGHALFSASMGGTPVQKVVQALQEEADQIFKGRATANVSLCPAATRYKDLLKQSREAMVNPETLEKIEEELSQAETEKKRLEAEISKLDLELGWIARCEDALPTVGTLAEEMEKLSQLPPLPEVTSDFISRVRAAQHAMNQTRGEVQRLTIHINRLKVQLEACTTFPTVLAEAPSLDQLHQDLGVYRDRKKSLATLREKLARLEPVLQVGMFNLQLTGDFSTLEDRRLVTAVQLACEEAAEVMQKALKEAATNADKVKEFQSQIILVQKNLAAFHQPDLAPLREALAVAAEATEANKTIATSKTECQKRTRETAAQHRLVVGAPADFEATTLLTIPALTTIRRYRDRIDALNRDKADQEKEVTTNQKRIKSIQGELKRLQRQGELPTEAELHKARGHRDHGWTLVLSEWKGKGTQDTFVPGVPLEEAFPQAIVKADDIGDMLRRDAEAVAQAEEKRLQIYEAEKQIDTANQKIEELRKSLTRCQQEWTSEWATCGITPRSPSEMEEWRTEWAAFCVSFGKLEEAKEAYERKHDQIQTAKERLATVLGETEEKEYSVLFEAARKRVQDGEQAAGERKAMAKQLVVLENELAKFDTSRDQLNTAVTAATDNWRSQCTTVGLPQATSPDAGLLLLRERKDLLVKFDEWQEASSTPHVTTTEIDQYETSVREKATALGVQGGTTEALEAALWNALTVARESDTRHNQLAAQLEQANAELTESQGFETLAEQTLGELMRLVDITTAEDLDPLLAHLEKRDTLQSQIDALRKTLSGPAHGQSVDEFVTKVRAENPDSLEERKSVAERNKHENENTLSGINETVFRLTNDKKALEKAGDTAADFRQQAESCAATLTQDAARLIRLRLAIHLLKGQIERFRKRIKVRSFKRRARSSGPLPAVHLAGWEQTLTPTIPRSLLAPVETNPMCRCMA